MNCSQGPTDPYPRCPSAPRLIGNWPITARDVVDSDKIDSRDRDRLRRASTCLNTSSTIPIVDVETTSMKLWKPGKNKEEGDEVLTQQQNQNVKQKMDGGDGKQSFETADDSLRASDTAEKTEANDIAEGTGAQATEENEDKYPKGWTLTLLFTALCLGVFLTSLDNSILATAIPKITDNFHSLNDVSWYASAYLLTSCAFQPTLGRVYSVFSVKWTFLISLAVFEIGSAICGAAPSSLALIVGRAVAGCGSSGIFSGGLTILGFSVPLRKRPIFVGIFSAMFGLASVLGPILGGASPTVI